MFAFIYEASSHIPEHWLFRLQTEQFQIIIYTLSSSLSARDTHFHPATSTFLQTDTQSSPLLRFRCQTISICHASPHTPHSENLKDGKILTSLFVLQRHFTYLYDHDTFRPGQDRNHRITLQASFTLKINIIL